MASTPVITFPNNGGGPAGANPRFSGSADAWSSVRIVVANSGQVIGQGVTGPDGTWYVDTTLPSEGWTTVHAQSFISPGNPNGQSDYSTPITIYK